MIKTTYNIELKQSEFEGLKEIVQEHYNSAETASIPISNIYKMFKVDREDTGENEQ